MRSEPACMYLLWESAIVYYLLLRTYSISIFPRYLCQILTVNQMRSDPACLYWLWESAIVIYYLLVPVRLYLSWDPALMCTASLYLFWELALYLRLILTVFLVRFEPTRTYSKSNRNYMRSKRDHTTWYGNRYYYLSEPFNILHCLVNTVDSYPSCFYL